MHRSFPVLPLLCLLGLLSCSSPSDGDANSYSGDNGIILNGSGYENLTVNFNGAGDAAYVEHLGSRLTQVFSYGSINGESAVFELAFPSNTTGTYAWKMQSASTGEQDSYMMITIGSAGETTFYARGGTTTVTEYGSIGFTVGGSFSGTLRTLDGSKSLSVNGRFSAVRSQ
jgi:hypothetical protein